MRRFALSASIYLGLAVAAVAQPQEPMWTITLPDSQVNYLGALLGREPYEKAFPVVDAIKAQIQQQQAKQTAAAAQAHKEEIEKAVKQRLENEKPADKPPEPETPK